MEIVSDGYIQVKLEFDDMVELIGIESTRKIRALAKGVKRSIEDAFHAKLVFDTSALISLEVANLMTKAAGTYCVFISKKVEEELKEVVKYGDAHGKDE